MSDVLRVKEKADIVDVISSYLPLVSAGKSFKATCPFHNEKSPSFFVSPDRQNYYCFGCGAKGDVIAFIEQYEGLDFPGALKFLADKYGVVLQGSSHTHDDTSRLYAAMEHATDFFERTRTAHSDVMTYLAKRGLSERSYIHWRIGYAPDAWRDLHDELIRQHFSLKEIKDAGLIRDAQTGSRVMDVFRNRVMFPIRDISGRVIAFSGRTLSQEKDVPKYVNSPETPLFKKSSALFGLYEARQSIRKHGYTILVEGQMDVLMMHEKGFTHTVASSGTAFTADQATILKRLSPRIMFLYDGDEAGVKAALRGAEIALEVGLEAKIARLPQGLDPADACISQVDVVKQALSEAEHAIVVTAKLILENEIQPDRQVSRMTTEVLPLIARLSSESVAEHFTKVVARLFNLSADAVSRDAETYIRSSATVRNAEHAPQSDATSDTQEGDRVVRILKLLYGAERWFEAGSLYPQILADMRAACMEILNRIPAEEKESYLQLVDTEAGAFEFERMHQDKREQEVDRIIADLLKQLRLEVLRKIRDKESDPHKKVSISKEIDILQAS